MRRMNNNRELGNLLKEKCEALQTENNRQF